MVISVILLLLDRILSTHEPYKYHNDCNDKENMDESTDGIGSDYAEKPENDEYDCDCCKHVGNIRLICMSEFGNIILFRKLRFFAKFYYGI